MSIDQLTKAHKFLLRERYYYMIERSEFKDKERLLNFCNAAQTITNPDKLSRWVGYIQGVLIERGILDIHFERDLTREIYKPIYESLGYDTTSITVTKD